MNRLAACTQFGAELLASTWHQASLSAPSPNTQCGGHSEWLCKGMAVASGSGLQVVIPKEKGKVLIQVPESRLLSFKSPFYYLLCGLGQVKQHL